MERALIAFKNVNKSYGDNEVLKDFNLEILKGEFVTVIGKSGSGKTTTLKLINGLLKADSGDIFINGDNIKNIDIINLRKNIGYVIQGVGLFPHMTIKKNISFVLDLKKEEEYKKEEKIKELLKILNLKEEFLDRYPLELSGGEKQRIGIARALASDPFILLMDEPFGAVDEITRRGLQDEIIKIQKKLNITIFFITHDIKEALKLGSKIIVMNNGNIDQIGSRDDIKNNPKTEFVKNLMKEY